MYCKIILLTTAMSIVAVPAADAQDVPPVTDGDATPVPDTNAPDNPDDYGTVEDNQIVVRASRLRGAVDTPYEPVLELNPRDIASYGVSSVSDLLEALAPEIGTGRGRGSGQPVVLINGLPVSGFRELRNIPPEAIRQVQVLPEEVALQYGYAADQRVINFILRENFSSINAELGQGLSTAGGYGTSEFEATYTKFAKDNRLNLNVEYEPTTSLTEQERDIVQPGLAANENLVSNIGPQDVGQFRTLLPSTKPFEATAVYSGSLSKAVQFSLNAAYERSDTRSLFGLNNSGLVVSADNPFARNDTDEAIRVFTGLPRPLTRDARSDSYKGGFALNGLLSGWRWSVTGDLDITNSVTLTDVRGDFSSIQAGLSQSDPALAINPFAGEDLGTLLMPLSRDRAASNTLRGEALARISGSPLELPAGEVTTTLSVNYTHGSIDTSQPGAPDVSLVRDRGKVAFNVSIPVFSKDFGIGEFLGDVSINANAGHSQLSDFGGLNEYGLGITWKPLDELSLSVSSINADSPPTLTQLGSPIIMTPNVPVFDLTRGQNALVTVTSGGNPDLLAERQRDIKLAVNFEPKFLDGLEFLGEYTRNRSYDNSASFPVLTPEIEAAFPGRIVRDAGGQLVSLDQRPVTFDRVSSEKFRYGLRFSKSTGRQRGAGGDGGGRGRGPRGDPRASTAGNGTTPDTPPSQQRTPPDNAGAQGVPQAGDSTPKTPDTQNVASPAPGGEAVRSNDGGQKRSRGRGLGQRGFGGRRGGRWNVFAYHTIALDESVLIRAGVPELDLLDGSATGGSGGVSRHSVEFGGGWFKDGIGFRLNGDYKSATSIDGSGLPGSSDLFFDDIATVSARIFFNFDNREKLTKAVPFLKGSRISVRLDNIFDAIQNVRDESGVVPFRYQQGFVDPRGRFFEISFRKTFLTGALPEFPQSCCAVFGQTHGTVIYRLPFAAKFD